MATQTLLTTAQVAQRLHVSRMTVVRRAATEGDPLHAALVHKLPGIRGAMLFDPGVIDQLAPRQSLSACQGVS